MKMYTIKTAATGSVFTVKAESLDGALTSMRLHRSLIAPLKSGWVVVDVTGYFGQAAKKPLVAKLHDIEEHTPQTNGGNKLKIH